MSVIYCRISNPSITAGCNGIFSVPTSNQLCLQHKK